MALDTVSRGDFSTNTADEASLLIDNLAASSSYKLPDESLEDAGTFKDLSSKMDTLLQRNRRTTRRKILDDPDPGETKELHYLGRQANFQGDGGYPHQLYPPQQSF